MPKTLCGIREFSRRLRCSPGYIVKLINNGIIKKTASGMIDPVKAVESMRNHRDPTRNSKINLTGICHFCGMEQDASSVGTRFCGVCQEEQRKLHDFLNVLVGDDIRNLEGSN